MRDVVRDCLKAAAGAANGVVGVAEEARRRAEGAARDLLELSGVHPNELLERAPEPVQLVVGVVRSEADKVWSRLGDGVVQVGVVLEFLEQQVRHLQGGEDAPAAQPGEGRVAQPRAEHAFPAPRRKSAATRPVRVVVDEDLPADDEAAAAARRRAAVPGMKKTAARKAAVAAEAAAAPTPARAPAARKGPARKPAPVTEPASAEKAPAKPAPAKKAATKKTVAKRAPAKKTAAEAAPAKKAVAKRTATKATEVETAPAKKAAAKRAAAQKSTAGQAAPEQIPAEKAAARKPGAKKPAGSAASSTGKRVAPKAGAGAGDE